MTQLERESALFTARRNLQRDAARQNTAFFIMSGIDLSLALEATGEERKRIILRIQRLLERERLKGMRRHWSYDLNRHIALKEAFDRLCVAGGGGWPKSPSPRPKRKRRLSAPQ